ncbi:hypothetical protein [Spongiactinospora sp. TRM90649]|uniref:hypothetical protein n=1 Tax=Spongiactinospora sp. TRM90649 TaxID=3031114 RepID=UPI0023F64D87|nr:hypothetical protein [Spongiactinospora sp. TRM90649]MDF5758164.1 hypothetical protein [Spongiactinospora sp. TRM90649]
MAEIIRVLTTGKIGKYLEGVVDVEDDGTVHGLDARGERWADIADNAMALEGLSFDDALIRYELWDGTPTTPQWDESLSGRLHLATGKVAALSCYGGECDLQEEFDLGRPDHEWHVRIHRRLLAFEEFTPRIIGTALFKFQFWSAAPDSREAGA